MKKINENFNKSFNKCMFFSLEELDEIHGTLYHSRKVCSTVPYKIIIFYKFICH